MNTLVGCKDVEYPLLLSIMDIIKTIGKRIKIARISNEPEISIEELAGMVGASRQHIGNIEAGKTPGVSFILILAIAKALGKNLAELVQDESISAESVAETMATYKTMSVKPEAKKNTVVGGKSASERVPRRSRKSA